VSRLAVLVSLSSTRNDARTFCLEEGMTMNAPTRFKSVVQRWQPPGGARSRPPAAPADDDDDWAIVIARAKMRAAAPSAPGRPPRAATSERTTATLDALMRRGLHSPASLRPVISAGRLADENLVTPPPVPKPRWIAALPSARLKRP
jgi:hypothetical protein